MEQRYNKNTEIRFPEPAIFQPDNLPPNFDTLTQLRNPLSDKDFRVATTPLGIYANKVAAFDEDSIIKRLRNKLFKIRAVKSYKHISSKRSCDCGKVPLMGEVVEVHWNNQYNSAKIANLETCGSVWECPVCRYKILSGRAEELKTIETNFKNDGGSTFMVTFTTSHYRFQSLAEIIGTHKRKVGFTGAIARMRQHREFRKIKEDIGYVADCRSYETTYGDNGWHFHSHMILYVEKELDEDFLQVIEKRFYQLWLNVSNASGLSKPSRKRGVVISKTGNEYLAKWGSPNELMSEVAKGAKNGNVTVSALESMIVVEKHADEIVKARAKKAELLLKEYYETMRGRKLLTWAGEKLRKRYLKEQKTDEDLSSDVHGDGERLCYIHLATWKAIHKTYAIGLFLDLIEKHGLRGAFMFLNIKGIRERGIFLSCKTFDFTARGDPEAVRSD